MTICIVVFVNCDNILYDLCYKSGHQDSFLFLTLLPKMLLHSVLSKKNLRIWNYVIKVVGSMKSLSAANLLRAVNQFLYSAFYYALLDEILKCEHSNESH